MVEISIMLLLSLFYQSPGNVLYFLPQVSASTRKKGSLVRAGVQLTTELDLL